MIRRRTLVKLCALGLLTACAPPGAPTPLPTLSAGARQAAIANETAVASQMVATSEARAATATARMLPTATATLLPPTVTPTPRAATATPPAAAANFQDFKMAVYQGTASLGGDDVRFSAAFTYNLPVVVNFWAPLCGPCRDEMPAFQRVSDEFAGRVYFLGVDISPYWPGFGDRAQARQLIRETQIRYPVTYATESPLEAYRLRTLPSTYFFSADGETIERFVGGITEKQLRQKVGGILASHRTGGTA